MEASISQVAGSRSGTKADTDGAIRRQPVSNSHQPVSDSHQPVSDSRQPVSDSRQQVSDYLDGDEVFTSIPFTPLLSNNQYTVRKMAAQAMMDVALMMANISQLRTLMSGGSVHITYFYLLLGLVVFSLVSQLAFGILIFVIWVRESSANQREEYERSMREKAEFRSAGGTSGPDAVVKLRLSLMRQREHYRHDVITNHLNHVSMVLVFLITVTNMFITGFGIEPPNEWNQQGSNHTPS